MDSPSDGCHVWRVNPADLDLDWLLAILPAGCELGAGPIGDPGPSPYPLEEAAVARAVARRRSEFRAGRTYARQALARIAGPAAAIGRGPGGEPLWPAGYTGSISHSEDFAAAVVASADEFNGVGLDLEDDTPLDDDLVRVVCRPDELAAARGFCPDGGGAAKRLLVAKEAFIKLSYVLTGTLPEVLDVRVELGAVSGASQGFLAARVGGLVGGRGLGYEGRLAWGCGRIAAVMYVRRTGGA